MSQLQLMRKWTTRYNTTFWVFADDEINFVISRNRRGSLFLDARDDKSEQKLERLFPGIVNKQLTHSGNTCSVQFNNQCSQLEFEMMLS